MEPQYEYVKGQGWVLFQHPVMTMRCGAIVMVVPRNPTLGERYSWTYRDSGESAWMHADGTAKPERFIEFHRTDTLDEMCEFVEGEWIRENRVYVTFIPV